MKNSLGLIKKVFRTKLFFFPLIIFFISFMQLGCATIQLENSWQETTITIDGKSDDWIGLLYYVQDKNISVGTFNDDKYFYVCLISENPQFRSQVMMQGLTLWFDPEGGKKKTFGIKFPLGRQRQELPMEGREEMVRERDFDPQKARERRMKALNKLEIIGPGKENKKIMPLEEAVGIELILEASSGLIVYECKIPLARSKYFPFAIGTSPGETVGVGFLTPKQNMNDIRKRMGGMGSGMPGGGRGGMGGIGGRGGMGSRGGMPGGGRGFQMPKSLKLWLTVRLASPGTSYPRMVISD